MKERIENIGYFLLCMLFELFFILLFIIVFVLFIAVLACVVYSGWAAWHFYKIGEYELIAPTILLTCASFMFFVLLIAKFFFSEDEPLWRTKN